MEVYQMREKIADVYSGKKWKDKVARMYDDQVIAIYYNFLETGVFDKKVKLKETELKDAPQIVKQLSIDDILEVKNDA